jgi:hypothetical protein
VLAFDTATTIVALVGLFFLLLAALALLRIVVSKERPPLSRSFRIGVFFERERRHEDGEEPPAPPAEES